MSVTRHRRNGRNEKKKRRKKLLNQARKLVFADENQLYGEFLKNLGFHNIEALVYSGALFTTI